MHFSLIKPTTQTRSFLSWLLLCACLLKAALPLLAVTAAERQALPLFQICSVYGLRTQLADPADSTHPASSSTHHECPLAPWIFMAGLLPVIAFALGLIAFKAVAPPVFHTGTSIADAARLWLMRRMHSPPSLA